MRRDRGRTGAAHGLAVALALGMLVASATARADATAAEMAAARQLFKEGKDLETKGAWVEAFERFKKVGEVKMTPQVRFHIALCDENLGRLVSAINGFERAAAEAKKGDADVAENAPPRAAALRKRVPTLRFVLKGELGSARLILDGDPVAPALIGTAIPVDVGAHTISLERRGKRTLLKEVGLAEQASQDIAIEVPDEDEEPAGDATPLGPKSPKARATGGGSRAPAIAAGVVGVGAFVGAGVFWGMRQSSLDDLVAACPTQRNCSPSLQSTYDSGHTYGTVSAILLGVGAAGVVAAGVLWFAFPPKPKATTGRALPVLQAVGITPGSVGLRGCF